MEEFKINDEVVYFDEETHSYFYKGKKCISVTQLLQLQFPDKYSGIDENVLANAAKRGSLIHETIEMYEKYQFNSDDVQELRDYIFLKKMFKFETEASEVPILLKYKDIVVCGRLDLVLKENNDLGLADIKTTCALDKEYLTYQLNLYRLAYMQTYCKDINFLRGIHLRKGTRKYVPIKINEREVLKLLERYYEKEKSNEKN